MVLGVIWELRAASFYRASDPMKAMEALGHEVVWPPSEAGEPVAKQLARCDLVHVYRRHDPRTKAILERLAAQGVAITYDNDDDLAKKPEPSAKQDHRASVKVAGLSQVMTTTTEVLAERYRRAGIRQVQVIDNQVSGKRRPRPRRHRGVVVGWVAGTEHFADARALDIPGVFAALQRKHANLHVHSVGVDLGLSERYEHVPLVHFARLPKRMRSFDIGIAPLADMPFNQARSDIKVKEYAASRIPWLASAMGPYRGLGESEGGRLVSDDGWFDALDRLVSDAGERKRLEANGREWAKSQRIDTSARQWEQAFEAAVELAAGRAPRARLSRAS